MKTNKKLIITLLVFVTLILIAPIANANFQITNTTYRTQSIFGTFSYNIRAMETEGQVMGLNETINVNTLESTSGGNNIDVHMLKSTEYGAILLLSASPQYGKQGTGSKSYIDTSTSTGINTTTGNKYGVYDFNYGGIFVAAGGPNSKAGSQVINYSKKYFDRYTGTEKTGDATLETNGWKGSSITTSNLKSFDTYVLGRDRYRITPYESTSSMYARVGVWCGAGF